MKKETIFIIAIISKIVGLCLIGIAIGHIFDRVCVGGLLGLGFGLTLVSFNLFRIFRRIDAYEKK